MKRKKDFFVSLYCCPSTGREGEGVYPNRINDAVYGALKDAGVNAIYGHYESFADRSVIPQELSLAEKHGLSFYPEEAIFNEFVYEEGAVLPSGKRPFLSLSEEEKKALAEKMVRCVAQYINHPACPGIFFSDEFGLKAMDGIGYAKRAFEEAFPEKEFHFNEFNYLADDAIFEYGNARPKAPVEPWKGGLSYGEEHRFARYDHFLDEVIRKVHPQQLSQDLYPFGFASIWGKLPCVHRGLYETCAFFADKKRRTNHSFSYLHYIQTGAWGEDCLDVDEGMLALQINMALAYGHEGVVFFPGCFPEEWAPEVDPAKAAYDHGASGLIDLYGRPTKYLAYAKRVLSQAFAMAPYSLDSEFLGVSSLGRYAPGYAEEDISSLPWNSAIYRGDLPPFCRYSPTRLILQEPSSQIMVSSFLFHEKEIYLLLNTSVVQSASCLVGLSDADHGLLIQGSSSISLPDEPFPLSLKPGEAVLLL